MITFSIVIHVLAATVWTGGHLALVFMYLIPAIKENDLTDILIFELKYEKVGMPALLLLVITGLYQSYQVVPDLNLWFDFSNHFIAHFSAKIIMILIIVSLALDMKLRVMKQASINLFSFSWHVFVVTILSVLLVITGLSFRLGIF